MILPELVEPRPDPDGTSLRILVASHGHPRIAKGGAEIAAYSLFRHLVDAPDCEAWFLGCRRDRPELHARIGQPFSEREFVYTPSNFDWFNFANRDPLFPRALEELLSEIQPHVIHFHHYANFGVEVFHIARRVLPGVRIALTLHEFLAICAHYGQMVKRQESWLCHRADPLECTRCFPERDPSAFYMREWYIKRFFEEVDHFIAPTLFLKSRYVEWGLPEQKITCIPDLISESDNPLNRSERPEDGIFRVGFFGQTSQFKGIDVLLAAARQLRADKVRDIIIEIHGDNRNQPPEAQATFQEQIGRAPRNVRNYGPYDESEVDELMRRVDVVVVPSIWWENRPLVVQEALRNRCPVICSNIGGMAETVRDGVDGFHFPVGDGMALARLLQELAADRGRLTAMRREITGPPPPAGIVAQHVSLYRRLLGPTG